MVSTRRCKFTICMLTVAVPCAAVTLLPTSVAARPLAPTDLPMMHRLGAFEVSPDGHRAVFTISDTDLEKNKRNDTLYWLDLTRSGAAPQPIAGAEKAHDAVFGPDGALWFLMDVDGQDQLFRMLVGGAPVQVSSFKGDIGGFKLAPSSDRVVVWGDRDLRCADVNCQDLPEKTRTGSGRVYDELFVRHWNAWARPGVRSRLFGFAIVDGKLVGGGVPLIGDLVGDTPSKPFGGGEELSFSRDGRTLFFTLREAGRIEALSINFDIFAVPVDGNGPPVNLTDSNDAIDTLPTISPDGKTLAYLATARPGDESDREVVQLRDLATGKVRALTQGWDRSVDSIEWSGDGKELLVTAPDTLEHPLFRVDVRTGKVTRVTKDGYFSNVHALPDGSAVATMNSINAPDDLYRLDQHGKVTRLTAVNRDLLARLDPVTFSKFSFAGANGDLVWGWTLKPTGAPNGSGAKLPIAFLIHGGPQDTFANAWSYRWNYRTFASPGYAVVSVDFHGSAGYGQAFTDSIDGDWGEKPLQDLQLGLAFAISRDTQLDPQRACALGGSYGGTMANIIEGKWPDRFKCLVNHDGVFDNRSMTFETDELWFDEWQNGGHPYYEAPQKYELGNPVNDVQRWRTPQLVITTEKDFRVPYTQGIAAFTALQRRNIPSRLLIFPDEAHLVGRPKNTVQWYEEVYSWLKRWL